MLSNQTEKWIEICVENVSIFFSTVLLLIDLIAFHSEWSNSIVAFSHFFRRKCKFEQEWPRSVQLRVFVGCQHEQLAFYNSTSLSTRPFHCAHLSSICLWLLITLDPYHSIFRAYNFIKIPSNSNLGLRTMPSFLILGSLWSDFRVFKKRAYNAGLKL